ncbi:error-prone DNA polymerase [Novosphingobium sp. JCM 18896]|uniref:error-prone DNA polymerase n=1 Tax=Novosphingobium sp. JCM 18896 TaxID=2989731 RepID=UPI00222197F2|nr:error-prone DNA polymerase [Novosphingobium sp. JCM 18896]MCW1428767.1 error-prone DNA polymerase [Novosphingobium sp. JCM 18896]
MSAPAFAELGSATSYSFLHGASQPSDMVARAIALGMAGIGIADRNTVAGVVRAHATLKHAREDAEAAGEAFPKFKLVVGARLVFVDGTPDILAYPTSRYGWGRLTRLLTRGNLRALKGDCILGLDDLLTFHQDLLLIVLPESTSTPQRPHPKPAKYCDDEPIPPLRLVQPPGLLPLLERLTRRAPHRVWLGATMDRKGDDARRLARWRDLVETARVPLIATNDALYAEAGDRQLHDVMTCIREGTTITEAGRVLEANGERHLKAPAEMARLFADCPEAIAETQRFLDLIKFELEHLKYEYPHEPVPEGWKPLAWLIRLVMRAAITRYGHPLSEKVRKLLREEFELIRERNYAYYFLTVYDLVRFARAQKPPILCQGRGSAANSIVCFLLGVTSVDPAQYDLLFSRFVSEERSEPPDIDVDFEHERREEVMQYVYERYGRHRAGIAATVIHFRARSAVREIGKALGISEDVTARLSSTVWGSYASTYERKRLIDAGFDPENAEIGRLNHFVQAILQFPRHLSQHVGGFVLTEDRLDETVPIHHAAMDDRTFVEWDKDDIDALGLMKVDVLALGMLTCIAKSFELMKDHGLGEHELDVDIDSSDDAVYDMLCKGESLGVFQVESRAQMNMLPRLKPRTLYDLTVQVAIVRPGPIEGDMVHPYLRRRCGEEKVEYPSPAPPHDPGELKGLLGYTYGVPIFQEQAMKLAITAAGFTPAEANKLRRAMATFRNVGTIHEFEGKMIEGMAARGYPRDFAQRCYDQIKGFGSYGFPESHALSFARLVYVSAWIKCHHPAVFTCALLNSQPMGFYAPAQLVRDARENGVEVRPVDVNHSAWDCTLECRSDGKLALRLGLRQVGGFRQDWAHALYAEAIGASGPFTSVEELARRGQVPQRGLRLLADADAFGSIAMDRRAALWEARRTPPDALPLFAHAQARELGVEPAVALPAMTLGEQVAADYQTTRLSLKDHPMTVLRPVFARDGILRCADLAKAKAGVRLTVAGVVLVRQRPGKGNAIFVTLEDETGIANVIMWARTFERFRREVMAARLMQVEGELQRSKEGVMHVMAMRIVDRTEVLGWLSEIDDTEPLLSRADVCLHPQHPRGRNEAPRTGVHPRDVRLLPKSRDFH